MLVPILGLAGYSGSGKTTLLEKLIPRLRDRGLRVAVIKHDGHRFDIDRPEKDSARLSAAGAGQVLLTSPERTALLIQRGCSLEEAVSYLRDTDMILVEGYKTGWFTQIGISRRENGKGFPGELARYAALVTDEAPEEARIPCFSFEEADALADYIIAHQEGFTHCAIGEKTEGQEGLWK